MIKKIEVTGYSNLQRNKNEQEVISKWTSEGWEVAEVIRGGYREKSYVCFKKPQKDIEITTSKSESAKAVTKPDFTARFEKDVYTDATQTPDAKNSSDASQPKVSKARKDGIRSTALESYEKIEKKIHFSIGQDLTQEQVQQHIKKIIRKWQRSRWEIIEKSDGSNGEEPYIIATKVNRIEKDKASFQLDSFLKEEQPLNTSTELNYQTGKPQNFYTEPTVEEEQEKGNPYPGCLMIMVVAIFIIAIIL